MTFISIGSTDPVSKYVFDNANETIEKWTEIVYNIIMKGILPFASALVYTLPYYFYYITKSGSDAFTLFEFMK